MAALPPLFIQRGLLPAKRSAGNLEATGYNGK
jgi:hypothetical protein